jgi:negative regulator of PHO system
MHTGRPLFPGKDNEDQLAKIFRILGTPNETTWPRVTEYPDWNKAFTVYPPQPITSILPALDINAVDLLTKMLQFQPQLRISAQEAMAHPFFLEVPVALRNAA